MSELMEPISAYSDQQQFVKIRFLSILGGHKSEGIHEWSPQAVAYTG